SSSPAKSLQIAQHASSVFEGFIQQQQAATETPHKQRVELVRLNTSPKPSIFQPRKKVRAIFAFFVITMLTIAAAFIRDNLRGRREAESALSEPTPISRHEAAPSRHSAQSTGDKHTKHRARSLKKGGRRAKSAGFFGARGIRESEVEVIQLGSEPPTSTGGLD